MDKNKKDIFAGIVVVIISILIFISSSYMDKPQAVKIGPDFVPKMAAVLFAVLGILLIMQGVKKLKGFQDEKSGKETKKGVAINYSLFATIAILMIYVALLEKVGFLIMTTLYLFVQFIILADKAKRNYVQFAIISIITSVSVYYIFVSVFRLMIPSGILG